MNNYNYTNQDQMQKIEHKRLFFKAQNRAACLMFLLLALEIAASAIILVSDRIAPEIRENIYAGTVLDAAIYTFYMLTPSIVYFAVRDRKKEAVPIKPNGGKKHMIALFFFGMGILYVGQLFSLLMGEAFAGIGIDLYAFSEQATSADPVLLIMQLVGTAVLPAIFEELLVRKIILRELLPYSRGLAVVLSALVFSLMHMNPIQMPFTFVAGLAMSYAAVYSGSILPAVALHFTNNALSVILSFLPSFFGDTAAYVFDIVISVLIFASGAVAAVYLLKQKRSSEAARENDLLEGNIVSNISTIMRAYIAAALISTVMTFISIVLTQVWK